MVAILQTLIVCFSAFMLGFIILLALPGSQLRSFLLEWMSKGVAGASALYVASPLDGLPDWLPVIGQADDLVVALIGIAAWFFGAGFKKDREKRAERKLQLERNHLQIEAKATS